jgi:hypothetical protein
MTLSRWLAEPGAPKETRGPKRKAAARRIGDRKPPEPPAAPATLPEGAATVSTLEVLRRQLAATLADCEAQRVVNPKLAQQLGRDAAQLANTVARLERGESDDADELRFSRRDIETAMSGLLEKVAGAVERCRLVGGLLCARCSRELSVELGTSPAPGARSAP